MFEEASLLQINIVIQYHARLQGVPCILSGA